MKKIACLILVFLFCLSLVSCSRQIPDTWSNFAEYDGIGFDLQEFIAEEESRGKSLTLVEISHSFEAFFGEITPKENYRIDYSDDTGFPISIFENVESAKAAHTNIKHHLAVLGKYDNPYVLAIRVDNAIVFGMMEDQNQRIIEFAKAIGIPEDQIELQKNNSFWCIRRKDTDKSKDEIIRSLEEKGFSIIDENVTEGGGNEVYPTSYKSSSDVNPFDDYKITLYTIASEDYSDVYQLYVTEGASARRDLYYKLLIFMEFYNIEKNNCHVYYSVNGDCCMCIMGVSAETSSLWDEIR